MPDTSPDRVYSEEEIGRILKRAADLQGTQSRRPILGLTLPELQQLARETDIDPQYIEAAALELAMSGEHDVPTFWGGPLTMSFRRRIEGSVSEDAFNRMVSEARRRMKKSGTTSLVGSTREWSTENEREASASFSLRERDGYTELEVFWSESRILPIPFITFPTALAVMSLPIFLSALNLTGALAAFAILLNVLIWASVSWATFRTVTARHRRSIRDFSETLVEIGLQDHRAAERGAAEARARETLGEGVPAGHDKPRIELDPEDSPESDQRAGERREQTR